MLEISLGKKKTLYCINVFGAPVEAGVPMCQLGIVLSTAELSFVGFYGVHPNQHAACPVLWHSVLQGGRNVCMNKAAGVFTIRGLCLSPGSVMPHVFHVISVEQPR